MKRLYEYICRAEVFVVKLFLVSVVVLVFIAASTRYLGYPINWSVDVALCLFAWCTFLGGDLALRNNKLMKVDFFINRISPNKRDVVELINLLLILGFLGALIFYGIKLSYTTRFRSFQGIPWFSYTWVTLSVPVGGFLMTITTVLQLRERIKKLKSSFSS